MEGVPRSEEERGPVTGSAESAERRSFELSSAELDPSVMHRFGDLKKEGVEGAFLNVAHGQDAFAIEGDAMVVCDGVSSLEHSGILSRAMAGAMARKLQTASLEEAFSRISMSEMVRTIATSGDFPEETNKASLTTVVATKLDREAKAIDFAIAGDSIVMIVDRNPATGALLSFEFLTGRHSRTNADYADYDENMLGRLKHSPPDPVGLWETGVPRMEYLDRARFGSVPYVPGRVVVLATDFLTKMLVRCPDAIRDEAKHGLKLRQAVRNAQASALEELFPGLWALNPATGNKVIDPLFFVGKDASELSELVRGYMEYEIDDMKAGDDMAIVARDLDHAFGTTAQ